MKDRSLPAGRAQWILLHMQAENLAFYYLCEGPTVEFSSGIPREKVMILVAVGGFDGGTHFLWLLCGIFSLCAGRVFLTSGRSSWDKGQDGFDHATSYYLYYLIEQRHSFFWITLIRVFFHIHVFCNKKCRMIYQFFCIFQLNLPLVIIISFSARIYFY